MPTLQEYAQLSNDAHNRADDFLFLDFTPGDIQKRVGGDGSSLQAGEVMKSYLAAKKTNSAWANITDHSRDCQALSRASSSSMSTSASSPSMPALLPRVPS